MSVSEFIFVVQQIRQWLCSVIFSPKYRCFQILPKLTMASCLLHVMWLYVADTCRVAQNKIPHQTICNISAIQCIHCTLIIQSQLLCKIITIKITIFTGEFFDKHRNNYDVIGTDFNISTDENCNFYIYSNCFTQLCGCSQYIVQR